jgi:hypothetical protein
MGGGWSNVEHGVLPGSEIAAVGPEWVVCHQVTREVAGLLVRCPARGTVLGDECLRCRFLTTSSVERTEGPWCELAEPAAMEREPIAVQPSQRVPVGPGIPLAAPAVRTPEPVQAARVIGT